VFKPETNADSGAHSVEVTVDDSISAPIVVPFTVTVERNEFLVPIGSLPNLYTIVNNPFLFEINGLDLFVDPEGEDFTYYYRVEDFMYQPYFIEANYDNHSIYGTPNIVDAATYKMELVGVDSAGQETVIKFDFIVQRKQNNHNMLQLATTNATSVGELNTTSAFRARMTTSCSLLSASIAALLERTLLKLKIYAKVN